MKAIILARVSTEEQITEGQSIPAQLQRAREYCDRKKFQIQSEHQFDESSIKDHRTKFERVVAEIEVSKEPVALVIETIDRLQRSFKESVLLDGYRKQGRLEIHFIRENLVVHKDSNSSELQRWDLGVFVARSFVLQISDNVKRTQELKRRSGEWTGKAPFGYLNVALDAQKRLRKDILPDPELGPEVVKIFENYASGRVSIGGIVKDLRKRKIYTRSGKVLYANNVHHILKNPFYYGVMRTKYGVYSHVYQPLISKALFEKVQDVLSGRNKNPTKTEGRREYVFRGVLKCGYCGCSITPELQKGNVYLSCTNAKGVCKREYVNEKIFLDKIKKEVFQKICLSDNQIDEIVEGLKRSHEHESGYVQRERARLAKGVEETQEQLDRLLDIFLSGSITQDIYDRKEKELRQRQRDFGLQLEQLVNADESYHITAKTVLSLAQRAEQIFESSEVAEKRQLLEMVLQNPTVKGKNLEFTIRKPFDLMAEVKGYSSMLPG